MRTLSADYLTAAKSVGRYPNVKINVEDVGLITGTNAVIEVHIVKGDTAKPVFFDTELALSSTCQIVIDRRQIADESVIVSGKQVTVSAAFTTSGGSEIGSALLGTFYITSYDKQDNVHGIITASDALIYTGVDFDPEQINYPASLSDIIAEAFRQSGLQLSSAPVLAIDPNVKKPIYKSAEPVAEGMNGNPYSCREILSRIAAMELGALFLDETGYPKFVPYGAVNTGVITDAMITDIRIGTETYYIDVVRRFKTAEKMAKTRRSWKNLPYYPRFENMDSISTSSAWYQQLVTAAANVVNKPWTTATVTIKGVGQIEIGDFVQAAGKTLLVTGICYDFVDGSFDETLYSFAYTEEEYLMSPYSAVTESEKIDISRFKEFVSIADPALNSLNVIKRNDRWAKVSDMTGKYLTTMYERVENEQTGEEEWQESYNIASGSGSAFRFYSLPNDPVSSSLPVSNGDFWLEIDNVTDRHILSLRRRVNGAWEIYGTAPSGGGSTVNINIDYAIVVDPDEVI